MSREELKPKDKVVMRMGKDGAVEENLTQGTEHRVSARPEDIPFVQPEELSRDNPSMENAATQQSIHHYSSANIHSVSDTFHAAPSGGHSAFDTVVH